MKTDELRDTRPGRLDTIATAGKRLAERQCLRVEISTITALSRGKLYTTASVQTADRLRRIDTITQQLIKGYT